MEFLAMALTLVALAYFMFPQVLGKDIAKCVKAYREEMRKPD